MDTMVKIKIEMSLIGIKEANNSFMETGNEKMLKYKSFLIAKFGGYIDALYDAKIISWSDWKKYLLITYKI